MKRATFTAALAAGLLAAWASPARAQIGKTVAVIAGTPEDKAVGEIYAAPDGPEKLALLDKFMAAYGTGDLALLGDQLYVNTYLTQKNYAKVYEYADKTLALDPDDLPAAVAAVHAADEQGDTAKLYDTGERVAAIVSRYKASPPPAGTAADVWQETKSEALKNAQADTSYVETTLFNAAYKIADPNAKAAQFERFAGIFADSPNAVTAREQAAFAYLAAQNGPKMMEAAQKILATDADNVAMLVMLADYWSDHGQQLDKAGADAQKAIDVLAQAKKPDTVSDEDWQKQVSLQKGLAYSALGQVQVNASQNEKAVASFRQASPLLKSNTFSYARNLYRLGFTLAKMQRTAEAKAVLGEAVAIDSPYRALAQQTLQKIGGAAPARTRKKAS